VERTDGARPACQVNVLVRTAAAELLEEPGGLGDVQPTWVIKMLIMFSWGSQRQMVPQPPSQPNAPARAVGWSRLVTTERPNPLPRLSK
jgi:hypothetical protein